MVQCLQFAFKHSSQMGERAAEEAHKEVTELLNLAREGTVWSSRPLCIFEIFHSRDVKLKMLIRMGGSMSAQTAARRREPGALTHRPAAAQEFFQTALCVYTRAPKEINNA